MTSAREAIHNLLDILLESPGTFSNLGENHGAHATTSEVELDSQIKKLLKISEAINKTIDHQLKVLHQRRNQSFSPLYRLPNEIIARIFEEALIQRQQSHFDSKLLLHDLGSISQRCRQVVMSHPTLWDTVSEEVGQNFRFEASIDTCKELEITSDDERLVTFYGFHCGQRGPTTCHIRACKKRDFKQVLTSFLEGPLAPYNFSGLRSLTFCGTRYTKPMPSVYATFLYDLHALETLALVGLFAAADTIVHCLISHVSGYSESGGAEVCCPRLEGLELIFSHVRTDFFLALVEHRVNNMSLKRLRMVHSDGLASIDTVLLIEQFIGRENFDWDGYAHLDEDWGSEGSMSEASTTDEEDIDGTYSMNIDEESNGMSISDDEESSDEEASSGMSISDEEESESTDQDDVLAEGGSQYSDWDADNEDTLSLWSRDSDDDRMPRWHSLAQS